MCGRPVVWRYLLEVHYIYTCHPIHCSQLVCLQPDLFDVAAGESQTKGYMYINEVVHSAIVLLSLCL